MAKIIVHARHRRLSIKKVGGKAKIGSRIVDGVQASNDFLMSTGKAIDIILVPKGSKMDWSAVALADFAYDKNHFEQKFSRLSLSEDDAFVSKPSEQNWLVHAYEMREFSILENKKELPGALREFGTHEQDINKLTGVISNRLKL